MKTFVTNPSVKYAEAERALRIALSRTKARNLRVAGVFITISLAAAQELAAVAHEPVRYEFSQSGREVWIEVVEEAREGALAEGE